VKAVISARNIRAVGGGAMMTAAAESLPKAAR
jgi:hypothetical protein